MARDTSSSQRGNVQIASKGCTRPRATAQNSCQVARSPAPVGLDRKTGLRTRSAQSTALRCVRSRVVGRSSSSKKVGALPDLHDSTRRPSRPRREATACCASRGEAQRRGSSSSCSRARRSARSRNMCISGPASRAARRAPLRKVAINRPWGAPESCDASVAARGDSLDKRRVALPWRPDADALAGQHAADEVATMGSRFAAVRRAGSRGEASNQHRVAGSAVADSNGEVRDGQHPVTAFHACQRIDPALC